jgi:catechol 2,3-dioxygenase
MGHVHLRVGDIERARKFYAQTLMFDVMNSSTDSLFIARDGYHHHIGMNTWQSIGAGFRDKSKYGLRYFEINYTDAAIFERIKQNLRSENINFELSGNTIRTADPWNNRLELHFK